MRLRFKLQHSQQSAKGNAPLLSQISIFGINLTFKSNFKSFTAASNLQKMAAPSGVFTE